MTTLLKCGSKGAAVKDLQRLVNAAAGRPPIAVDGHVGAATEAAVRAAQSRLDLVVDGIAGPQTMTALRRATDPVRPGQPEPDKAAMAEAAPAAAAVEVEPIAPPNAVQLLDTARPIDTIFVHCTATPEGRDFTVADIRGWHKARGWSDIGYHFVVYRDGRVMPGRPIGQVGSHVAGHNTGSIGIAYVGGVTADGRTAKDTRTPAQRAALLWLVRVLAAKHGVSRVRGHNEVAAKACPSFDVRRDPLGAVAG
jgi:peptidoglycan hydrolase-like protein with peptidoglycan-binding domain